MMVFEDAEVEHEAICLLALRRRENVGSQSHRPKLLAERFNKRFVRKPYCVNVFSLSPTEVKRKHWFVFVSVTKGLEIVLNV